MQLKKAEKATSKAASVARKIIESVNKQFQYAKIIEECIAEAIPEVKLLQKQWKESTEKPTESIKLITKLDQ